MKIEQLLETSTTSGCVAPVATSMGTQKRSAGTLFKGKKTKKPYYEEAVVEGEINEEDVVLAPGKGRQYKPGLLAKPEPINPRDVVKLDIPLLIRLLEYAREDASNDMDLHDLAEKLVARGSRGRTLTMKDYDRVVEGVIAGGGVGESKDREQEQDEPSISEEINIDEGAKVDRMVKHIEKSEKKLGKSKKDAENIAWATVNKRGYLDNKNKKKKVKESTDDKLKTFESLLMDEEEGISQEELANVLMRHLTRRYPDIISRCTPEAINDAVSEVAGFHAGATELGTSDIGHMLRSVLRDIECSTVTDIKETTDEKMTPKEFHRLLKKHDWYYAYSDDHRYWVAGEASLKKIRQALENQPELKPIYDAWVAHKNDYKNNPEPTEPIDEAPNQKARQPLSYIDPVTGRRENTAAYHQGSALRWTPPEKPVVLTKRDKEKIAELIRHYRNSYSSLSDARACLTAKYLAAKKDKMNEAQMQLHRVVVPSNASPDLKAHLKTHYGKKVYDPAEHEKPKKAPKAPVVKAPKPRREPKERMPRFKSDKPRTPLEKKAQDAMWDVWNAIAPDVMQAYGSSFSNGILNPYHLAEICVDANHMQRFAELSPEEENEILKLGNRTLARLVSRFGF